MDITVNNTVSTVAALSQAINETEPADQLQVNFVVVVQVFQAVASMARVQGPLTISDERQVSILPYNVHCALTNIYVLLNRVCFSFNERYSIHANLT